MMRYLNTNDNNEVSVVMKILEPKDIKSCGSILHGD